MKKFPKRWVFSALCLLFVHSSFANDKAIYGRDDRFDYFQMQDAKMLKYSNTVAAQIYDSNLDQVGEKFIYNYPRYGEVGFPHRVCETEKFVRQQTGANCTGFLIAPDVMVTAGHCISHDSDCQDFQWAFDYKYTTASISKKIEFTSKQLVRCSKIIDRVLAGSETGLDYAVIKLERKMTDREILKVRTSGKVDDKDKMTVIGFPSGLPMKFTLNGNIRDNSQVEQFIVDNDAFRGNSGSPVINSTTGMVEGILVRGENDYSLNPRRGCLEVNRVSQDKGRGEDVIRITEIPDLKKLIK